jgi:hypothetical protein
LNDLRCVALSDIPYSSIRGLDVSRFPAEICWSILDHFASTDKANVATFSGLLQGLRGRVGLLNFYAAQRAEEHFRHSQGATPSGTPPTDQGVHLLVQRHRDAFTCFRQKLLESKGIGINEIMGMLATFYNNGIPMQELQKLRLNVCCADFESAVLVRTQARLKALAHHANSLRDVLISWDDFGTWVTTTECGCANLYWLHCRLFWQQPQGQPESSAQARMHLAVASSLLFNTFKMVAAQGNSIPFPGANADMANSKAIEKLLPAYGLLFIIDKWSIDLSTITQFAMDRVRYPTVPRMRCYWLRAIEFTGLSSDLAAKQRSIGTDIQDLLLCLLATSPVLQSISLAEQRGELCCPLLQVVQHVQAWLLDPNRLVPSRRTPIMFLYSLRLSYRFYGAYVDAVPSCALNAKVFETLCDIAEARGQYLAGASDDAEAALRRLPVLHLAIVPPSGDLRPDALLDTAPVLAAFGGLRNETRRPSFAGITIQFACPLSRVLCVNRPTGAGGVLWQKETIEADLRQLQIVVNEIVRLGGHVVLRQTQPASTAVIDISYRTCALLSVRAH